ncbi:MAG: phage tail tip lysozyme [Lachnospiraceae bacterium]|nr:phage tail tip lysozyme [Lachnospiraceae bacterium]
MMKLKSACRRVAAAGLTLALMVTAGPMPVPADEAPTEPAPVTTDEEMTEPGPVSTDEETMDFVAESSDEDLTDEESINGAATAPIITGFAPFAITEHYLEVDAENRPSLEALTAAMPETLEVYISDDVVPVEVPVTWWCVEGDFATVELAYVQFSPAFEAAGYELAEGLDVITDAPYIGVYLKMSETGADDASFFSDMSGEEANRTPGADSEDMNAAADATESTDAGISDSDLTAEPEVRHYAYTSSPYESAIFAYLTGTAHFSVAAACGIMTNIYTESSFYPNNLQNTGNKALGMTDDQYTRAVDNGSYPNFVGDKYGYGLIQWTFSTRKQGLLNLARQRGVSISDMTMQLDYMMTELKASHYATLRNTLNTVPNTAQGAYNAAHDWCYYFEKPANYPEVSKTRGNMARDRFWPLYNFKTTFDRIGGSSRYDTAISVADRLLKLRGKSTFEAVVVANAANFPDALGGVPLAYQAKAPILLSSARPDHSGTQQTLSYINKHLVPGGRVYILGSETVVSAATEATLRQQGYNVKRLSGADRYETNQAIISEMAPVKGGDIFLVSGKNFPDALAVSARAAVKGAPVILVGNKMRDTTLAIIRDLAPGRIYVIGGAAAVSDEVVSTLAGFNVTRIEGNSRFTTAVQALSLMEGSYKSAVTVTGLAFPDGLTAGLLAAELNIPMLLVSNNHTAEAAGAAAKKGIDHFYVVGGEAAVSGGAVIALMR